MRGFISRAIRFRECCNQWVDTGTKAFEEARDGCGPVHVVLERRSAGRFLSSPESLPPDASRTVSAVSLLDVFVTGLRRERDSGMSGSMSMISEFFADVSETVVQQKVGRESNVGIAQISAPCVFVLSFFTNH